VLRPLGTQRSRELSQSSIQAGFEFLVVLHGERVLGARDLDFDSAHKRTRQRGCNAGFLQNLERFRLHRHWMTTPTQSAQSS
jgi:hypothetical protein